MNHALKVLGEQMGIILVLAICFGLYEFKEHVVEQLQSTAPIVHVNI